jgi:hypothetical protein
VKLGFKVHRVFEASKASKEVEQLVLEFKALLEQLVLAFRDRLAMSGYKARLETMGFKVQQEMTASKAIEVFKVMLERQAQQAAMESTGRKVLRVTLVCKVLTGSR